MTYNKTIKGRFEDLTPDEFVIEVDEEDEKEEKKPYQKPPAARKVCPRSQEVYDIFDKIEMPIGNEDGIFFVEGKFPKEIRAYGNRLSTSYPEALFLSQLISEETGENYKLPMMQQCCDKLHKERTFRDALGNVNIINMEAISKGKGIKDKKRRLYEGKVIYDMKVKEKNGNLDLVTCKYRKTIIDEDDLLYTMVKAKLFSRSSFYHHKLRDRIPGTSSPYHSGHIIYDFNYVVSFRNSDPLCPDFCIPRGFGATTHCISDERRNNNDVVALIKEEN